MVITEFQLIIVGSQESRSIRDLRKFVLNLREPVIILYYITDDILFLRPVLEKYYNDDYHWAVWPFVRRSTAAAVAVRRRRRGVGPTSSGSSTDYPKRARCIYVQQYCCFRVVRVCVFTTVMIVIINAYRPIIIHY